MSEKRIFISYRRTDAGWAAHQIYQRLVDEFGDDRVFMDIDDIPLGVNFRDFIGEQMKGSAVCLALIGPRWVATLQELEQEPRDFVRIELELAHELAIPIYPLTLDDTPVPREEELPRSLLPLKLPDINSQPIRSGADLKNDLYRLVRNLRRLVDKPAPPPVPAAKSSASVDKPVSQPVPAGKSSASVDKPVSKPVPTGKSSASVDGRTARTPFRSLPTINFAVVAILLGLFLFGAVEQGSNTIAVINGFVWGPLMLVLILGTGLFLQVGLKILPIRKLVFGFKLLWKGRVPPSVGKGEISPFNALMTSLAATIGTGNIAGVATAIFLGGPGALFWMWCTALVGMATKFAEAVCAVKYREVDELGNHVGGPMYYIKNGLSKKWLWLAPAFAGFGTIAGFGIGNTVQANSVADALNSSYGIPSWVTGVALLALVGAVILGGIKRIAQVAGKLVPFMAVAYLLAGLVVLSINFDEIPAAFGLIFTHAFTPTAATGGFAGAAVWAAIQFGVARGVFSNEAGLGSAPIAHAAAQTKGPVNQGLVAMLGTFIDTLIVCSITGLAIITSGAWTSGETGASLTSAAFESAIPGLGAHVVTIALAIFAFTTMLGWSFYGEKCVEYLFGVKSIHPFRILWCLAVPLGATADLGFIWLLADTLNALMALPNLIALILLSPVVFKLTREFLSSDGASEEGPATTAD